MKRFLLAAGLALTIHGFLLGAEPDWIREKTIHKPKPRVVTLALSYYQPQRTQLKPATKMPDIRPKKTVPVKKNEQKHIPKKKPKKDIQPAKNTSKPQTPPKMTSKHRKLVKPISQQKKENVSKVIRENIPPSKPKTSLKPEQLDIIEEPFESLTDFTEEIIEDKGHEEIAEIAAIQPAQVIREARPMYRTNPPPNYPRLARKRGYEGTVVLEVLVNQRGSVKDLHVFKSSGHTMLDKVAVTSVKGWLFEPGMRGDKTVEMWVCIPICFQLK